MAPLSASSMTSNIQWLSGLNVDIEPTHGRKTCIIGTIGLLYQFLSIAHIIYNL